MADKKELEYLFIERTLVNFGYRLRDLFIKELTRERGKSNLIKTGRLRDGISYDFKKQGQNGGELCFNFPDYGRFIEIHYFKPSQNTLKAFAKENYEVFTSRSKKLKSNGKRKKDTRWYAKTAYGNLNWMIGELMYGFTDDVKESMRASLVTK